MPRSLCTSATASRRCCLRRLKPTRLERFHISGHLFSFINLRDIIRDEAFRLSCCCKLLVHCSIKKSKAVIPRRSRDAQTEDCLGFFEKKRRDSLTLSPPLWGDFMRKWHQILFMAEKEKHKTTTAAVCHRCSCERLRTCVRMQALCVRQAAPPSTAFPFSSPFEVETVTHMLSEELFFRFCRKGHRRVKCLGEPSRISRRCKSLV